MNNIVKFGAALALVMGAAGAAPSFADNMTTTTTTTDAQAAGTVDAGKLIGKNVVDANGDTVGEIDSVMVDPKGKVKAVVLDVSGWLQSEKLISVAWSDLHTNEDGTITSHLMKDEAKAAADFKYADETRRRRVLTENGDIYADNSNTADTNTNMDTSSGGDGTLMGTPVRNPDGSVNASQLVGVDIKDTNGDKIGEVGDVVIGSSGKLEGVLVDVGGFLGMGEHHVLLNWKDIKLEGKGDDVTATVAATKESLKAMPEFTAKAQN
jgi:sporulation protein YlmC with PRC-barrel domain